MLNRTFGCVRVVWNYFLAERHARYHNERKSTSYEETNKALTVLKKQTDFAFLNEVSSVPLQHVLRHQHSAFQAFFAKRCRYPRFKTRNSKQSVTYARNAFNWRDGQLTLAKMNAPIHVVWSWPDVDPTALNPSTVTVSRGSDGRWFVVLHVEVHDPLPLPTTGRTVGVDLGLKDFAVLSTGERISHPKHMEQREARLKRYQRAFARKQRGSCNRAKAKMKVARYHAKVRDARRDFLHQESTRLVRSFERIAIEDLAVRNMVRNRRLAKSIGRTGWAEFRSLLTYKCERYGRELVVINRFYPSSKTCSNCGHLLSKLPLEVRHWRCPRCGTRHDRDVNAAKNLDAVGMAVYACGGDVRRNGATQAQSPVKQELSVVRSRIP
jgi:putative transposase